SPLTPCKPFKKGLTLNFNSCHFFDKLNAALTGCVFYFHTVHGEKDTDCIKSVAKHGAMYYTVFIKEVKIMEVEIKIDPDFKNPKAVIHTAEITEEVTEVSKKLSSAYGSVLTGFIDGKAQIIEPGSVVRFYCMGQRVFAVTDCGELVVRSRLYDLEEKLSGTHFARISNSEIINLKKTEKFDFSIKGTIHVKMKNGDEVYASRRYVSRLKNILGV
ncbi:MAG: LytTR family DNA-binding domain-containing protein, partial [Oscillospiraceae bacterium]